MRTRVKICGITNQQDALNAVQAGADALGLVFYPPSPRYIDIDAAAVIAKNIPAFVTLTALFVNANVEQVRDAIQKVSIQLLQFHGDESPEYCEQFGLPYIKALRVGNIGDGLKGDKLRTAIDDHKNARAILLDAYKKGVPGGTGEQFDWDLIPNIEMPVILAGGLSSANVKRAIEQVKPYAVDVSGGVEKSPGIKDITKIHEFFNELPHH